METKRKKIIQLSLDDKEIKVWDSISEASKNLNLFISGISNVLRGKYNTSGGFKFKYK
jgi:hypothetical protein